MRDPNPWAAPEWLGEPSKEPSEEPDFSVPVQEVPRELWFPERVARQVTPVKRLRRPVRPGIALPLVIVLALMSAFFSWVSAEPLWLAVGHGKAGTATVTRCIGEGLTQRCIGELEGARVTLHGVTEAAAVIGSKIDVRRVSEASNRAYAGALFMRWFSGLLLVLLCGFGIALATGVRRLEGKREKLAALGTCLAAPYLVTVGFLAATF